MSEKNSSYANNALLALSDEIQYIADNVSKSVVSIYSRNRGDQPITNLHDLRRQLLKQDAIGKSAKLTIIRAEKKKELVIIPEGETG